MSQAHRLSGHGYFDMEPGVGSSPFSPFLSLGQSVDKAAQSCMLLRPGAQSRQSGSRARNGRVFIGEVTQFKRADFTQLIEQGLIRDLRCGADEAPAVASAPGFDNPTLAQDRQCVPQGDCGNAELGGQGTFIGELFAVCEQTQIDHFYQATGNRLRFPFLVKAYET